MSRHHTFYRPGPYPVPHGNGYYTVHLTPAAVYYGSPRWPSFSVWFVPGTADCTFDCT